MWEKKRDQLHMRGRGYGLYIFNSISCICIIFLENDSLSATVIGFIV